MADADPKIAMPVAVGDLRAKLSAHLKKVSEGATIVIMSRGKAVARLEPFVPPEPPGPRKLGLLEGKIDVPDDFDAPLPDDILDAFEADL